MLTAMKKINRLQKWKSKPEERSPSGKHRRPPHICSSFRTTRTFAKIVKTDFSSTQELSQRLLQEETGCVQDKRLTQGGSSRRRVLLAARTSAASAHCESGGRRGPAGLGHTDRSSGPSHTPEHPHHVAFRTAPWTSLW